jgi:hypothetical protein
VVVKKTETSPDPSWGYFDWLRVAEEGLRPLSKLMKAGKADLPILGKPSSHGAQADRLESFSRPCLWAAHWLQATPTTFPATAPQSLSRKTVADWFRQALLLGTDPSSSEYWGPTQDNHQHTVEMAALVLALEIAHEFLWDPLSKKEKEQVAQWFASVRGTKLHPNNHLFFGVLTLSFLEKEGFGQKTDAPQISQWLDILETMAIGNGWFRDGSNQTVDYYNAYAFHYYGLWWGRLFGQNDPTRSKRWQNFTREFLPDYSHFFAASGENVPFGRSLTYRFNAVAPFALAELCECSPLAHGQSRRISSKNLHFFWSHPIQQSQGLLSLGWIDEFIPLTERYSCGGSPYWAAKGLSALLLPPSSPFWQEPEQPLPSEISDFSKPLPKAELVVRSIQGEIELLNAGTAISKSNTVFGPYKWGKLSYRTGVGFDVQLPDGLYPIDSSLTAQMDDGSLHGRQQTRSFAVEKEHLACSYPLGDCVEIETHLWWNGPWQLHLHRYKIGNKCRLLLGGQSLSAKEMEDLKEKSSFPTLSWNNSTHHVVLQSLQGFAKAGSRRTIVGKEPRTHIYAGNSVTLFLETDLLSGEGWLAALHAVAPSSTPLGRWELSETQAGTWSLKNQKGELWTVRHPILPSV